MQLWSYVAGAAPGLILSLGYAAVFVYGGHRVIAGTLSLGTFVAFMAYQMRLLQPVQALMGLYASLATVEVSLARVDELFAARPEVEEPEAPVRLTHVIGAIEFDGVSIDLGRGGVLTDVSFSVSPGELLAVVGPSGSGKSTVADLLVRLIDPDSGTIRIDGRDIRTLALEDLRRRVVLVDQEPFLFHASIADNIRYARPDADEAELRASAKAAGLEDFINRQPDGYDTVVGERGTALSAGERQRLAIARAILAAPDVLLLDEPTASLDPAAERHVVGELRRLMHGKTVVVITHRAAVAEAADRVVQIADGRAVEVQRAMSSSEEPVGRGVRVAVVDSGVHASHPHVGGVAAGVAIGADGSKVGDFVDRLGHGTAVAAAIHEKAPGAELVAVKVFWRTLSTDAATLVRGIDAAADLGAQVINLSLGTRDGKHRPALEAAVDRARQRGAFVVSAAPDSGGDWYPGALDDVVPVELDWSCDRHTFGVVTGRARVTVSASGYPREIPGVDREVNLKGISFAVANVSGFVARMLERESPSSVDALFDLLRSSAYNRVQSAAPRL